MLITSENFVGCSAIAAEKIGLKSLTRLVDGPGAVDAALIQQLKRDGAEAIIAQPVFTSYRERIVALALDAGLPVTSDFALFAEAGALFTLGADDGVQMRRTAYYVASLAICTAGVCQTTRISTGLATSAWIFRACAPCYRR